MIPQGVPELTPSSTSNIGLNLCPWLVPSGGNTQAIVLLTKVVAMFDDDTTGAYAPVTSKAVDLLGSVGAPRTRQGAPTDINPRPLQDVR
ncbi:hypothetical protein KQX54_001881 [Cotesia glomerata]|uniref:Uncharacterized protein n=1 Tax=Cotesia glomerata TaxID=32391 RepID=A0AAV7HWQ2_COTGL|nr:hypothetical protein KQX54_001881 [Cotesia glomerata]